MLFRKEFNNNIYNFANFTIVGRIKLLCLWYQVQKYIGHDDCLSQKNLS